MFKRKVLFPLFLLLLPNVAGADTGHRAVSEWIAPTQINQIINPLRIQFDGFDEESILDIEEYLVAFTGYDSHETIYSKRKYWELSYNTRAGNGKIKRNLFKMMKILDLDCSIKYNGNTFVIIKSYRQNKRRSGW